ncbi:NUDIX domain-containing protein [Candidatus Gracilibacteria bacterium]|nr:NUDIX domain-containing protein [Candidatus Gracilibacteria bacterium]
MAKKYEKSSGGIVYRKAGDKVEILLLKWRNSKQQEEYVIPKGHIEEGEIAKVSALREISEETGLKIEDLEVIKFITKINYTFKAGYLENTPLIDKDVYLFLVKYKGNDTPIVQKEERFIGYEWILIDNIKNIDLRFDLNSIISKNRTYFI